MQINKKLFTVALTALLVLSMLAVAAPAFAISTPLLSDASGNVGDTIGVSGNAGAAQPGSLVTVYWENVAGAVLNTTYSLGDGSYSLNVKIPNAAQGAHSIIVQDPSGTAGATFTVNSKITRAPTSGIVGDTVTITGTGFSATSGTTVSAVNVTFDGDDVTGVALVTTNSTGNFVTTINVPAVVYGTYNIVAADNGTSNAPAVTFTVGASITLSPTSGPPGTVVTITGRGFTVANEFIVPFISAPAPITPIANLTVMKTAADGTFSGTFVVPSLPIATPGKTVSVTDGVNTATATFTLKGETALTVSPTSAAPGATVTVTGTNFTAVAGTSVTLKLNAVTVGTFTTNSSGGFTGTFAVPQLPTDQYDISAVDTNLLNVTNTDGFAIAITALFATPTSGATGTVVTLTGFGFGLTGGTTFNVTLGPYLLTPSANTVAAIAAGTPSIVVPTMPAGAYTLAVTDDTGLTASVTFTVTETSSVTVNPGQAPVGVGNLALTVRNFANGLSVNFFITNSTNSYALTTSPAAPVVNSSKIATATFTVPTLDLGAYTIIANESTGTFNATTPFTIGAATITVSTGATEYTQGNTVSFNIQSTFASDTAIVVVDPTGYPIAVMNVPVASWVQYGGVNAIPSGLVSFTLPSDAATGTYNWTASLASVSTTKTGNFTVKALTAAGNVTTSDLNTTLNTILSKLNNVTSALTALDAKITSISGNVATIQTSMGTVTASVNSLSGSISGINSGIATIQTSLGTVQTSLSTLDAVLGVVAGDTTTIKTSMGDYTTSLAAINTKVTSIEGDVATVQTDLGTLKGTVTSISGNVATIQTSIGTMQADISGLEADVSSSKNATDSLSPLIIVAIVLALVAAIAAIASIVLMRRKIAG